MVLMPVKTAPGSLRAPRGRGINKSMKPRVQQLCAAIDSGHAPAQKQGKDSKSKNKQGAKGVRR